MLTIIDESTLQDPLIVGFATFAITEISKRIKWIPLDPKNPNQIKVFCGITVVVLMIGWETFQGKITGANWRQATVDIIRGALLAWNVAHVSYNALPYVKESKPDATPAS